MKVRGRSEDIQQVMDIAQQDAIRVQLRSKSGTATGTTQGTASEDSKAVSEDTVSVGLSQLIKSELDPEAMAAERRKRIEELKTLVASGKYNPPIDKVAEAVTQEIAAEIYLSPAASTTEEE